MRLKDKDTLLAQLEAVGGKPVAKIKEMNTYFDTGEGNLKAADEGLRIRVEDFGEGKIKTILTHKGPRAHGKLKSRSENEAEVLSAKDTAEVLGALGYTPVLSFEKHRERWEVDGCRVEIDELPYLGSYVEIEGPSDEIVMAVRDKLNLNDAPLLKASYIAMLSTYLQEKHIINLKQIVFDKTK